MSSRSIAAIRGSASVGEPARAESSSRRVESDRSQRSRALSASEGRPTRATAWAAATWIARGWSAASSAGRMASARSGRPRASTSRAARRWRTGLLETARVDAIGQSRASRSTSPFRSAGGEADQGIQRRTGPFQAVGKPASRVRRPSRFSSLALHSGCSPASWQSYPPATPARACGGELPRSLRLGIEVGRGRWPREWNRTAG